MALLLAARLAAPLAALLLAQAAPPVSKVPPEDLEQAKHAIPVLLGRVRRGEQTARAALDAPPVERFLSAMGEADLEQAWKQFRRLQRERSDLPWGEIGMGRIYVQWHIPDQAQAAFDRALQLAPGFPIVYVERAQLWRYLHQPDKARADAEAALAQDPRDARALLVIAQLDDEAGVPVAQKKAEYAAALAQSPDLYEAGAALAALSEMEGDEGSALAALDKLAEASPRDPRLQRQIATLRRKTGNLAGAALALETAVSLGLSTKESLLELARLDQKLGRRAQEEPLLKRLHRMDPKDREVVVRLAQLHEGDAVAQLDDARALLNLDTRDAWAHLLVANAKHAAGDTVAELTELDLAAAGKPHAEAPDAADKARDRAKELRAELGVPSSPLTGANVNTLYYKASSVLTRAYEKRRAEKPELRGHLELKVKVNNLGTADNVELVQDGLGDKPLATCVLATLREAKYPVKQQTLTFKFDLAPPRGSAK